MTEQKHCVRCERAIDAYARICPYCNWDQNEAALPPPTQSSTPAYVPPAERNWRRHVLLGIGGVVLLIASFAVGALVHGNDPPPDAPEPVMTQEADNSRPSPRTDVTLVPVGEGEMDMPITSAPITNPASGVPTEYQRSDATAVSSAEYAQLAARANEEKKSMKALVDPRSITGPAYAQAPRPAPAPEPSQNNEEYAQKTERDIPQPAPAREPARVVIRTRPVPEYQPLPDISVSETTTARLDLVVGSDGRVKDINIRNGIPGHTAKLIGTVQRWRFKPATENGVPVSAPFTVDVSFRGND